MVSRFLRFPGGKSKALTFSYDDGVEQDIRLVDIFRKHGLKGTFNINAGLFAPEGTVHPEGKISRRMTIRQCLDTYSEDTCEVACHGYCHAILPDCDSAAACMEVIDDRRDLEKIFKRQIHGMAYAYGRTNDQCVDILRNAGIYYSRTTVSTEKFDFPTADWLRLPATCHHRNPRLMELADKFLDLVPPNSPKLFYVWGHTYEFERDDNWQIIEAFAEKMAFKDDIWYATNMEIYTAWHDYMQLESSVDGSVIFNPTIRSVWIADKKNNVYEIKPGQSVTLP